MKISWARLALAMVLLASSRPAWCEGGLDADVMERYGGTYLSDCKNPASPRVTVFENALVFIQGDKRITAQASVQNAPSYFGQSPPENFDTLLMGEIPGGETLMLMVYADGNDLSIKLDGDAALRTKIGKPALALTYRRCDARAKGASAAPPPAPTPARARPVSAATPDAELPAAGGMILDPGFKAAYFKALGRYRNEPWLATLDG